MWPVEAPFGPVGTHWGLLGFGASPVAPAPWGELRGDNHARKKPKCRVLQVSPKQALIVRAYTPYMLPAALEQGVPAVL